MATVLSPDNKISLDVVRRFDFESKLQRMGVVI